MEKGLNDLGGVEGVSQLNKIPSLLNSLTSLAKRMINLKVFHHQAHVTALKEGFMCRNTYLSG